MLKFLSAGESHGKCLTGILDGFPAGVKIDTKFINTELARRQSGFGRGGRMNIECDKITLNSGVRKKVSIGSPISFCIRNKDFSINSLREIYDVRPGHADLAGVLKYSMDNARDILERASARETAVRVAAGAFCKLLLSELSISVFSHVECIGNIKADCSKLTLEEIKERQKISPLRCADLNAEKKMAEEIKKASSSGDSLGGCCEIIALNVPVGLGSHTQWDRKLDSAIAQAMMSINAIKCVAIGNGDNSYRLKGSHAHDEIYFSKNNYPRAGGYHRKTNNAGGIEGGISNGEPISVKIFMKPIPTLAKPLNTINIKTHKSAKASKERSDCCAVPSAGIIGESMLSFVLAGEIIKKFGGDSIGEIKNNFNEYVTRLGDR
ncbi:MAG: chorismate synthase [bacterium]|nr:chorismate synthase [bacterium]